MGVHCSCRAKDQTMDHAASNLTDRAPAPKETSSHHTCDNIVSSDSSEADSYDGDTGADSGEETRHSHHLKEQDDEESKRRNIQGFKDAVFQGNDSLIDYFLREHSKLNLLDLEFENGDKCLHVAVRRRYHNVVLYLLHHGVDANLYNERTRDTPLHVAAEVMDIKMCLILLQNKGDANVTNRKFETPLNVAQQSGDEDVIEMLSPEVLQKVDRHITKMGDFSAELNASHFMSGDDEDDDYDDDDEEEEEMEEEEEIIDSLGDTEKERNPISVRDTNPTSNSASSSSSTSTSALTDQFDGNRGTKTKDLDVVPVTTSSSLHPPQHPRETEVILADVSNILHVSPSVSPALSPMVSPVISPAVSNQSNQSNQSNGSNHSIHSNRSNPSTNAFDAKLKVEPTLNEVFSNSDVLYEENKKIRDKQKRELKLNAIRIARTNPFSKLKRLKTQKALKEFHSLRKSVVELPKLEAWLSKQTHGRIRQWHDRWVILKDGYLLWNDKLRSINDTKDKDQRDKFHGHLSLMMIELKSIQPVDGKKKRKFTFTVKSEFNSKKNQYLFKAPTETDRDHWVESLDLHVRKHKHMVSFLALGKMGK